MMININLIKQRRKEEGYTLKEMAEFIGFKSINGYWRIEAGLTVPSIYRLKKILDILGISMDNILL